jgi:hypothetical protein
MMRFFASSTPQPGRPSSLGEGIFWVPSMKGGYPPGSASAEASRFWRSLVVKVDFSLSLLTVKLAPRSYGQYEAKVSRCPTRNPNRSCSFSQYRDLYASFSLKGSVITIACWNCQIYPYF